LLYGGSAHNSQLSLKKRSIKSARNRATELSSRRCEGHNITVIERYADIMPNKVAGHHQIPRNLSS
jgi:hypothetical protein